MPKLYKDMTPDERQQVMALLAEMVPEAFELVAEGWAADLLASSPVWEDRFLAASSENTPEEYLHHLGNADVDTSVRSAANRTLVAIRTSRAQGSVLAAFAQAGIEAQPGAKSAELVEAASSMAASHKFARPFLNERNPMRSPDKHAYLLSILQTPQAPAQLVYGLVMHHKKEIEAACGTDAKTLPERTEAMSRALDAAIARASDTSDRLVASQLQRAGSEIKANLSKIEAPRPSRRGKKGSKEGGKEGQKRRGNMSGPVRTYKPDKQTAGATPPERQQRIKKHDIEALREKMPELLESRFGVTNLRKNICCPSPDHEDASPSAHYYEKNNTVHCFGCGKTWDAFQLIAELDGIEKFGDQAMALARETGYSLDVPTPSEREASPKPGRLPMPTRSAAEMAQRLVSGDISKASKASVAARRHPGAKVNRMTR